LSNILMGIALLKLLYALLIFIITAVVGYLPITTKIFASNDWITGVASTFAGGVFLGIGLLHLLPESTKVIEENLDSD
jgi:zinc transporter 1/2/3